MTALLFMDFETTSLNTRECTVLEGAWTLTNLAGIQLMPLQHRYMELYRGNHNKVTPAHLSAPADGCKFTWNNFSHGDTYALRMAQTSWLFNDWLICDSHYRLQSGSELERLLLDDIASYCAYGEDVHLCGAGVARFDFNILTHHCSRVVPDGGGKYNTRVSYRPVDTSGNQLGLLGEKNELAVIKHYANTVPDANLEILLDEYPRYCLKDTNTQEWWQSGSGTHRAAPDVARSVLVQRALWAFGQPLREALAGSTV